MAVVAAEAISAAVFVIFRMGSFDGTVPEKHEQLAPGYPQIGKSTRLQRIVS